MQRICLILGLLTSSKSEAFFKNTQIYEIFPHEVRLSIYFVATDISSVNLL
jgi:hypothetical protein